MGGQGSGNRGAVRGPDGRFIRADAEPVWGAFSTAYDAGFEHDSAFRVSRVELEPWLARCLAIGDLETAEIIRTYLAGRTWQWHNPYAKDDAA